MSDDQNYSFWLYEFSLLSIIDFFILKFLYHLSTQGQVEVPADYLQYINTLLRFSPPSECNHIHI